MPNARLSADFDRRRWLAAVSALGLVASPALRAQARLERPRVTLAVGGLATLYYLPLTIAQQLNFFGDEGLSVELQELQDTDLAPVTGFSAEELNTLLSETTEPAEEEEPEEEEPEEDSFNLTLSIPIEYKEQVQDFVKSFGPEDLIQKIIDMTS